jgi:AraC-like DNA-binding protein
MATTERSLVPLQLHQARAAWKRRASLEEMALHGAVGHHAIGDCLLAWCASPSLCGLALWGRPTSSGLSQLVALFDQRERTGIAAPCDFVLDARRLEQIDIGTYNGLSRAFADRIDEVRHAVRRHALVLASGLSSAALSGFYLLLGAGIDWQRFDAIAPALDWLGESGTMAEDLDQLAVEAIAASSLVERLRGWITSRVRRPTSIDGAARELGMSPRTLQRRLQQAGTSYSAEVDLVRTRVAQQLLVESDHKIATIAALVGCSNGATFIASFRRVVGLPPAEWRRRNRG